MAKVYRIKKVSRKDEVKYFVQTRWDFLFMFSMWFTHKAAVGPECAPEPTPFSTEEEAREYIKDLGTKAGITYINY
jgi:hypothetical protein